jgi:hypothetical protein
VASPDIRIILSWNRQRWHRREVLRCFEIEIAEMMLRRLIRQLWFARMFAETDGNYCH